MTNSNTAVHGGKFGISAEELRERYANHILKCIELSEREHAEDRWFEAMEATRVVRKRRGLA